MDSFIYVDSTLTLALAYSPSWPLIRIVVSFWRAVVWWWSFWYRSGSCGLIHGRGAANWATNTSWMTRDVFISDGLCKVSLEWLLVLSVSIWVNYVEKSLVLILAFLFMVECRELRATTPTELSGDMLFWRPRGIELFRDRSSVTAILLLVVCQANLVYRCKLQVNLTGLQLSSMANARVLSIRAVSCVFHEWQ